MSVGGVSSALGKVEGADRGRGIDRAGDFLAREGLLVVVGAVSAIAFVAGFQMSLDSWYTLLGGDLIVHHGLPSHDTLATLTAGRRWVDQQWLAQTATYGLYRLGGFAALAFAYSAVAVGAYAGSLVVARARGASARSTAWVAALALLPFYVIAANPRAQTVAFALFVLVLAILRSSRPLDARRILLLLGTIALWANVHGSVVIGAALVAGRGLVELARRNEPRRRAALALVVLPWPFLLASPYGLHLVAYYRKVLVGSGFSRLVVEWAPTTLKLQTVPLYVLAFGSFWILGAARRRVTAFDAITLVALLVLSLVAARNMGWFVLAAMMILPSALDAVRPEDRSVGRRLGRINVVLAIGALVLLVALSSSALASVDRKVGTAYPAAAARTAAAVARCEPRAAIFADVRYADWLLWSAPSLRGRIALDIRYELLRRSELERVQKLLFRAEGWTQLASRYGVFVLDPRTQKDLVRSLSTQLGFNPIYRGSTVVVLARHLPRHCRA